MASEAIYISICPVCNGEGQLETKVKNKNGDMIKPPTICELCEGKKQIFIVKKMRRT